MVHCLLCGTLNHDDVARCSLCRTEPDQALQVITESRQWVNAALVIAVFITLIGSLSLDLYLANRMFMQSEIAASEGMSEAATRNDLSSPRNPVAGDNGFVGKNRVFRFFLDLAAIFVWLVFSVAFIGGMMYMVKKTTMYFCYLTVGQSLKRKVALKRYTYPGIRLAHAVHFKRSPSNVRGTL